MGMEIESVPCATLVQPNACFPHAPLPASLPSSAVHALSSSSPGHSIINYQENYQKNLLLFRPISSAHFSHPRTRRLPSTTYHGHITTYPQCATLSNELFYQSFTCNLPSVTHSSYFTGLPPRMLRNILHFIRKCHVHPCASIPTFPHVLHPFLVQPP